MDIEQLHRELFKAILAADAQATKDTAAFVRQFLDALPAGAGALSEKQTQALEAWAERGIAQVHAGIAQAIRIGGLAGTMTSELAAKLAEEAFTRTWQDGKQLSTRLWDWKAGNKQDITQALQQGIRQMQGVSKTMYDMQRAIEGRAGALFEIVNTHQDDWVSELYDSAQTLIHDPKAKAQWVKTVADIHGHVAQLAETGTKHAAERVLDQITKAVAKGNADLVQSAVRWWIYDHQLYNLKRIVRTEMANAGHTAIIASTQDSPDIIGYQWRLSASHPYADICDYYASIEMGLGKGVWPKGQEPKHKAHPHCMCLIVPRVTPVKTQGSVNYAQFVNNATPERRAELLPKWVREAMASGTKLEDLLRPDGLGLVTQADAKMTMRPNGENA